MARFVNKGIPLWANILLISFVAIFVVCAIFCLAAHISQLVNDTSFVDGCSNIWFSIFPSLKQTTEEVVEEVVEATASIIK